MEPAYVETLLTETPLLDYNTKAIQNLIAQRGWRDLPTYDRIGAVYHFVKDEIKFGYNRKDALPASHILQDGIGQCNTKGVLLMALFRGIGIPCRLHGFTIKKQLQRGVVPELIYPITPDNIIHSWVEIYNGDQWINLEGFILDADYLTALQSKFKTQTTLCAYGVGTNNLQKPMVNWQGVNTYIQKTGINQDFGVFADPDRFFAAHSQDMSPVKQILYQLILRHWMNKRVAKIRSMQPAQALDHLQIQKTTTH